MEVRIALFDDEEKIESVCYPVKDKDFFDKLFEYADLLRCKEKLRKGGKLNESKNSAI